jgi:hypothetical protein
MKFYITILAFILLLSLSHELFAQDDDGEEIKMTKKEWHLKRDQYAVSAITLLSRLETLNAEIDSLKLLNDSSNNTISGCEDALYALVGATKQEAADFRIKFEQTENSINNKSFTPSDVEKTAYNEITDSKIRCLPEFASRYGALKNKIDNFTETPVKEIPENNYIVTEGDNLWSISISKYGNPYMWRLIWRANKLQMKNHDAFNDKYFNEITNPNLIFPGQVLTIPSFKESDKNK